MGEFVGIEPGGARQLITLMETAKSVLAAVRPGLETAIAEAGPEWTGRQGTMAMHRSWAFFNDSQRDLRWRITVITQVEDTRMGKGLLSAQFAFTSEAQAAQAGTSAAFTIQAAFDAHQAEFTPESWAKVEAALAASHTAVRDPAYAAALLTAIGPSTFRLLFGQWMTTRATGPRRGLPPETLAKAQSSLGVLATAFATADRDGRLLSPQWRSELLGQANPATLSALLALAHQSYSFLNEAGIHLLGLPTAGHQPSSADADWNTHWLVTAYQRNPQALQNLLAERPEAAFLLLRPDLAKHTDTPGFEKLLAETLDKALNTGADTAVSRQTAWVNLINGLGYEGAQKPDGIFATLRDSPISQVLAKGLEPYIDQLARGQAQVSSPDLGLAPSSPWNRLDPTATRRFTGALIQDPQSAKILQKEFQDYLRGLDIGTTHPFSSDANVRAEFTRLSARAGGLASMLLGGSTYVNLNDDEFTDLLVGALLLPVDLAINKLPVKPGEATAIGYQTGFPKDKLADFVKDLLGGKTPATAAEVADALVNQELQWLDRSLQQHGQEPLTAADRDQIRQEFRGRLLPALTKALETRGG